MTTDFEPVKLTLDGKNRTAYTAEEETKLRFDGWHLPTKKTSKTEDTKTPTANKS